MFRSSSFSFLAVAVVALAACSSDKSPTGATAQTLTDAMISQDVAIDAGDDIATQIATMVGGESASGGLASADVIGRAGTEATATCSGPDGSGFYTCAGTTENEVSVTRSWRFWNGTSVATAFSPTLTDSVNHRWTITGSRTDASRSRGFNVADTGTMRIVRGATPQRIWTGFGLHRDSATVVETDRTKKLSYTARDTILNLTFNMPRSTNPYPAAGSVTHNVTVVGTLTVGDNVDTRTTTRRAVATFDGTNIAQLQVGALHCQLNLDTHKVSGCQ